MWTYVTVTICDIYGWIKQIVCVCVFLSEREQNGMKFHEFYNLASPHLSTSRKQNSHWNSQVAQAEVNALTDKIAATDGELTNTVRQESFFHTVRTRFGVDEIQTAKNTSCVENILKLVLEVAKLWLVSSESVLVGPGRTW